MEMAELWDKLNFAFALLFVGSLCCVVTEGKDYSLCMHTEFIVTPLKGDTGFIRVHPTRGLPNFPVQCKMKFHLCKACRLYLRFERSNVSDNPKCYPQLSSHCYQSCNYLRVVDEYYNSTHAFLFRPDDSFLSVSNSISVTLCNNPWSNIIFAVKYRVERKVESITNPLKTRTFKSPGFPSGYKSNGETFLYEIRKPRDVQDMFISFTDWIMNPMSKLIIYNTGRALVYMGNSSRPAFHSSHSIQMTFDTGVRHPHYSQLNIVRGFKAEIICRGIVSEPLPDSSCGQSMVQMDYGGRLKFSPHQKGHYDCVWVILIHPNFKLIGIQVEHYHVDTRWKIAPTVDFYEGLTSEGRLIGTVRPDQKFAFQNPFGFYIRLRGLMEVGDLFAMTYASSIPANVDTCPSHFKCDNGYCIHPMLKCDGINHCLDKSDERDCTKSSDREIPYNSIASNWSVSIIIPVVITIFIFIILCLFFIFVRRFRKISRGGGAPRRHTRVASIGGSLSQQIMQNHFSMNLTLEGELDAPPSYEEVMNTPSPRGNWNLAFNWSQQDLRDTPAPPPYSEYVRENEVNTCNEIADTSDIYTVPTDTSSSNNYTDPTSDDQNSTSGSDTLYSENIYATICDTPTNSLDRWMVDRSTSTSEEEIDLDMDNNNKIVASEPVMGTQIIPEVNTDTPSLRKDLSENSYANQPSSNFSLSGADSNKSSPALEYLDPLTKEDSKNNIRFRNSSVDRLLLRSGRSRSMDSESNYPLDFPHNGQGNTVQNPGNKNCSSGRRNSYPSVIFLADQQLNNEVFV